MIKPENVRLTSGDKELLEKVKPLIKGGKWKELMLYLDESGATIKLFPGTASPFPIGAIQLLLSLNIDFYSNAPIIPPYTFANCTFGKNAVVFHDCTSIGDNAFYYAFLKNIKAPKCVSLGYAPFKRADVERLELTGLKNIGTGEFLDAFCHMPSLEYLDIRGIDSIPLSSRTFKNIPELRTVVIGKHTKLLDNGNNEVDDESFVNSLIDKIDLIRV